MPKPSSLQPDPNGPFGWRAPYRGLEALEPEDAAVFFGRSADIVRGIDALRGLAARKPPRLLVVLGASGAGKSSFLRAGLWPRLVARRQSVAAAAGDPRRPRRRDRRQRRASLRARGRAPPLRAAGKPRRSARAPGDARNLRRAAARAAPSRGAARADLRAALSAAGPVPRSGRGAVRGRCRGRERKTAAARARRHRRRRGAAACHYPLGCLRPHAERKHARRHRPGAAQSWSSAAGRDRPRHSRAERGFAPQGRTVRAGLRCGRGRAPASRDRRRDGRAPAAGLRAAAVDARARRQRARSASTELDQTGGVAAAIERKRRPRSPTPASGPDRAERREALRRLFIPRLARIDRDSKAPQRRVARQSDLPADLLALARALTQRRLLVAKLAAARRTAMPRRGAGATTLEVAHEALLRRWPTLADLLAKTATRCCCSMACCSPPPIGTRPKPRASRIFSPIAARACPTRRRSRRAGPTGSARSRRRAPISRRASYARSRSARRRKLRSRANRKGLPRSRRRRRDRAPATERGWALLRGAAVVARAAGLARQLATIRRILRRQAQLDRAQANVLAELSRPTSRTTRQSAQAGVAVGVDHAVADRSAPRSLLQPTFAAVARVMTGALTLEAA